MFSAPSRVTAGCAVPLGTQVAPAPWPASTNEGKQRDFELVSSLTSACICCKEMAGGEGRADGSVLRAEGPRRLLTPPHHLRQPMGLAPSGVSRRVTAAVARPWHLPAVALGVVSQGRSNLGWERDDVSLMIAFDFVILAVIALSGNLKDSVWKCSQIITIIQKEGKIVFLPVQMEPTIKSTPEPPSSFLWVGPDSARPREPPADAKGTAQGQSCCQALLVCFGGICLSATAICSGRRGDEDLEAQRTRAAALPLAMVTGV